MRRKSTVRSATTTKPSIFQSPIFNFTTIAVLGGVLILGIGIGIAFSSTTTLTPSNVASREFIDTKAPNPEICVQYGASAMVMDARLFVTLNPFNVYVAQPSIRPGCVIRQNNWAILENKRLVTSDQVRECKNRLNTFGFTGDLDSEKPDIRCIYQNESAQNFFLSQPGAVAPTQETERF
ncbi:MAG: DUF3172 domain-containing protein [Sphaerospermopsis kisseleviana]|jgi:hypothetical protein|uniref:DUF3172 domain-containing protein n=3 Tax=Sphaerospermopsis TaxID=752201 RepID=A0A479ZR67_9CYAN|nr:MULTISPECIES: DUF3172 domain-containing protein [Sphaerospermopsis]BAZ81769.1 hypothetical protein NIES73_30370 [Sphaerospermopsis kisseleviana NIES-73]MBC5794367.1 DUF3172 domain-containing protein [Sphaerospermopsis sp. LEGE 00249]MBD2133086.1 DUF3172 domain-containing protein [Sphaerospermopsis sp. FACHB-1094]MBD2144389.1 DUF3172 domain-containing protein [Sphaerospermopsis sp. FACHB-1194]MBE9235534.1 DUF3172 domain-containing protein [Sphaerospermopsis aphanizomenoides LEGE 00250]